MNMWEYLIQDGVILNVKGQLVDISDFVEDYSNYLLDNDRRFKGSFYELSREELDIHFEKVVFEV